MALSYIAYRLCLMPEILCNFKLCDSDNIAEKIIAAKAKMAFETMIITFDVALITHP
jgi:hypothetical protein